VGVALDPSAFKSLPCPSASGAGRLVGSLRASFDAGYTRGLNWRRQQLLALRTMLYEHRDQLAERVRADFGTPRLEVEAGVLGQVAAEAAFALKNLERWTRPERIGSLTLRGRRHVRREPLGVVLLISPWNHPVSLLLAPLVGAIAAGNCAALAPPPIAARTSALLAELLPRYLDPGAIALVEGDVPVSDLLEQRFDQIYYSGGGEQARLVMQAAARHLTPVTIELVGKTPCIVDAEIDIREVSRWIAWGKFRFAGQTSAAPDYVLVHERRANEFVRELRTAITALFGSDPQASPHYAPIANAEQFERLVAMLPAAEVLIGGEACAETRMIAPTVVRVPTDAPIMRAEVFGPLLPVFEVRGMTEAIDFVNDRDDPLALYVFSDDEDVQHSVVEQTRSGGACVNGIPPLVDRPFPVGAASAGAVSPHQARLAFERFSQRISVLNRSKSFESRLLYPSYNRLKTRLASWMF
jgi:aldehyde dehydrogenase (NAD+)